MPSLDVLEELAPGRTLVQIVGGTHDGRQVVVMGGGRHLSARDLAWYLDGEVPPQVPFARERSSDPLRARHRRQEHGSGRGPEAASSRADARANALLESLLSSEQRDDWRTNHRFWVPTPYGSVQLGWLYHLEFRPTPPARRLVLCVVPVEPSRPGAGMPLPDLWANLLLLLLSDPDRFFAVANWRFASGGEWRRPPLPLSAPALAGPDQAGEPVRAG